MLLVTSTTGFALILVWLVIVASGYRQLRVDVLHKASVLADMTGLNCTAALMFDDTEAANEILNALQAESEVLDAFVYTSNHELFATYHKGNRDITRVGQDNQLGSKFEGTLLRLNHPIELDEERIGYICLNYDLQPSYKQLIVQSVIIIVVMIISLLLAYLLSTCLQRALTRPVQHLADTAHEISAKRNYTLRATCYSNDELGDLTDSFNGMLQQIQLRDVALENARNELEIRVQKRTADLEKTNSELQSEITERIEADRALRESQEQHKRIFETMTDGLIIINRDGIIIEANPAACNMYGYMYDEFIGISPRSYITDEYHEAFEEFICYLERSGTYRRESIDRKKNGTEIDVEIAGTRLSFRSEPHMLAIVRDVTDRKQAESEREAMHAQLVETSRTAGMAEVATGVLHNVGNVLNSINVSTSVVSDQIRKSSVTDISAIAQMLEDNKEDLATYITENERGKHIPAYLDELGKHLVKEQSEILDEFTSLTSNLSHIIDIVSMQQSYSKITGIIDKISITELIEDALHINEAGLKRHGVQVIRNYNTKLNITADKHKILQILVNIISNAKYALGSNKGTERNINININEDDANNSVRIEISDNGMGIETENITRIFSHGFTTRRDGHGYGLHSSALAAHEQGGSLTAHSDGPGRGATFILELPMNNSEVAT